MTSWMNVLVSVLTGCGVGTSSVAAGVEPYLGGTYIVGDFGLGCAIS